LHLVGSIYQFIVFFSLMPTVTRLRLESREVPIWKSHTQQGRQGHFSVAWHPA
jgi:hypothetical protein